MARVLWFRADLRIHDNPALLAAAKGAWADGDGNVVPVVLLDPAQWPTWSPAKQTDLIDSWTSLDKSLGGNLVIRHGKAQDVIPAIAKEFGVSAVHCAADDSEYGAACDDEITATLAKAKIEFVKTESGYADPPASDPEKWPNWIGVDTCDGYPERSDTRGVVVPVAREAAVVDRLGALPKDGQQAFNPKSEGVPQMHDSDESQLIHDFE